MFRSVDRQTGSYPENEVLYGFATIQELASTAAVGRLDTRVENSATPRSWAPGDKNHPCGPFRGPHGCHDCRQQALLAQR